MCRYGLYLQIRKGHLAVYGPVCQRLATTPCGLRNSPRRRRHERVQRLDLLVRGSCHGRSDRNMTATNSEAQSLRYAEELSGLIARERGARRQAEAIAAELQASYVTTVRALAAALDLRDDATGAHAQRVT